MTKELRLALCEKRDIRLRSEEARTEVKNRQMFDRLKIVYDKTANNSWKEKREKYARLYLNQRKQIAKLV